ncbi:MAG: hypothetical protein FWF88_11170 [Peptococcaceae bacterium]|nr:hypothetical protein [Peptococcaceae bacterium]
MTAKWYEKLQQATEDLRSLDKEMGTFIWDLNSSNNKNIGVGACTSRLEDMVAAHVRALSRLDAITPP